MECPPPFLLKWTCQAVTLVWSLLGFHQCWVAHYLYNQPILFSYFYRWESCYSTSHPSDTRSGMCPSPRHPRKKHKEYGKKEEGWGWWLFSSKTSSDSKPGCPPLRFSNYGPPRAGTLEDKGKIDAEFTFPGHSLARGKGWVQEGFLAAVSKGKAIPLTPFSEQGLSNLSVGFAEGFCIDCWAPSPEFLIQWVWPGDQAFAFLSSEVMPW